MLPVTASDLYVQVTCLKVQLFSMLSFCCINLVLGTHGLLFCGFVFQLYEMIVGVVVAFDSFLQSREKQGAFAGVLHMWGFLASYCVIVQP